MLGHSVNPFKAKLSLERTIPVMGRRFQANPTSPSRERRVGIPLLDRAATGAILDHANLASAFEVVGDAWLSDAADKGGGNQTHHIHGHRKRPSQQRSP